MNCPRRAPETVRPHQYLHGHKLDLGVFGLEQLLERSCSARNTASPTVSLPPEHLQTKRLWMPHPRPPRTPGAVTGLGKLIRSERILHKGAKLVERHHLLALVLDAYTA